MAIKTNKVDPSDQLKRNKNVRIFQIRCPLCNRQEFMTLYNGEEGAPETKIGRPVTELPQKCPHCGATVNATEFPIFSR